ncbi:hypothetical protein [Streptomyces sp. NPDC003077]|uniref:hypothetical protein n=1 Tax=Streptomyces sp. NPDC003077 TaxID=3154443 RepID=UPI0033BF4CA3
MRLGAGRRAAVLVSGLVASAAFVACGTVTAAPAPSAASTSYATPVTSVLVRAAPLPPSDEPLRAWCRTGVRGSTGSAECFNPNASVDRVRLHVECRRWYDPDVDTAAERIGPAGHASLSGRCWHEVDDVWISHDSGR